MGGFSVASHAASPSPLVAAHLGLPELSLELLALHVVYLHSSLCVHRHDFLTLHAISSLLHCVGLGLYQNLVHQPLPIYKYKETHHVQFQPLAIKNVDFSANLFLGV